MKHLNYLLLILGISTFVQQSSFAQKKPLSPHASAMAMVGSAHIHIDYSSPGVRGRTIFGGLLPYGKIWVAGAGDATSIEFNKDVIIEGKVIPAGKYGLFVIPDTDKWTLIINTRWNQHGTQEYDAKEDILRIEVTPSILENIQEHLKYEVNKTDEQSGIISLAWEKTKVAFSFKVKNK